MKTLVKAKANTSLKKETLGLITLALFAIIAWMVPSAEAQEVVKMLTDSAVVTFVKFVFGFIALVKVLELISDLIKGQTDGILKDVMAIVFSIVMAVSYDRIIKSFDLGI